MDRTLCIRNLDKRLGDFLLQDVSLQIEEGEYFVILGPTGTGKTVILETIAGLYRPDAGEILFRGEDFTALCPEERNIGFVYQDYALFPHLDVEQNIAFGLALRGRRRQDIRREVHRVARLLGIDHLLGRDVETLSGGEQQRVAIARIIVLAPSLLLLDEPLSALDPQTKERFFSELKNIHRMFGTTTLHITHDFNEAIALADRIAVMKDGRLLQVGTPHEVFNRPVCSFVARFVGVGNIFRARVAQSGGETLARIDGNVLRVKTDLAGEVCVSIRPEEVDLASGAEDGVNRMEGTVLGLWPSGAMMKVSLDVGFSLHALVPRRSVVEQGLAEGAKVSVCLHPERLHVFRDGVN